MKKGIYITLLLTVLLSIVIAVGCRKTPAANNAVNGQVKTQTITYPNGSTTTTVSFTYTYDSLGRQVMLQPNAGAPTLTYYYPDSVTEITGSNTLTYYLNSQGLATRDNQGNTYTYDVSGLPLTEVIYSSKDSLVFNNINGNCANFVSYAPVSISDPHGLPTFYTNKFMTNINTLSLGTSFLGANNHNLVDTLISIMGTDTNISTSSYIFDGQGRVVTQTTVDPQSGGTFVYSYTYTH